MEVGNRKRRFWATVMVFVIATKELHLILGEMSDKRGKDDIRMTLYRCTMGTVVLFATTKYSYLPANLPECYFFITLFPLVLILLLLWFLKKIKKWHLILSAVIVLLICGFFIFDSINYNNLNRSYYHYDSAFNDAAKEFLPTLSEYEDAAQLHHYHGRDMLDEWILVEVTLRNDQYHEAVSNILQSHTFYDRGEITDRAFVRTNNPFSCEGFDFQIVDLKEQHSRYIAVVGTNSEKNSIIFIFAEGESSCMMSLDHVVGFFMEKSKQPIA